MEILLLTGEELLNEAHTTYNLAKKTHLYRQFYLYQVLYRDISFIIDYGKKIKLKL